MINLFKKFMKDSLYNNSFYLIVSTFILSGLGFVFWVINARLFTPEQVGIATTIISTTSLIMWLSIFGINNGIVRYLPKFKNKNDKINTCMTFVIVITIIFSTIFLLILNEVSPKLAFIRQSITLSFLFIIFMVFVSLMTILESVFVALRKSKYILYKNTIFGLLKLVFPFILVSFGAYGLFSSYMLALVVAFIYCFFVLIYKFNYKPKFTFSDEVVRKIGTYSFGNHIAVFIIGLPTLILPLLITNMLSPEITAYYYISMMIAGTLLIIPNETSKSLFAEGSFDEKDLGKKTKKAGILIAIIMIPAIILTIILGKYILLFFGKTYSSEGYMFLSLIALSGIFVSINSLFISVFKIKKKIKEIIFRNILGSATIIGLSYYFIKQGFGLLGIGFAWIIGNALISLTFVLIWIKER